MKNIIIVGLFALCAYLLIVPSATNALKARKGVCEFKFRQTQIPNHQLPVELKMLVSEAEWNMKALTDTTMWEGCEYETKFELKTVNTSPAVKCIYEKATDYSYCRQEI